MINITEGFNEILKSDLNENCYNSTLEASCKIFRSNPTIFYFIF